MTRRAGSPPRGLTLDVRNPPLLKAPANGDAICGGVDRVVHRASLADNACRVWLKCHREPEENSGLFRSFIQAADAVAAQVRRSPNLADFVFKDCQCQIADAVTVHASLVRHEIKRSFRATTQFDRIAAPSAGAREHTQELGLAPNHGRRHRTHDPAISTPPIRGWKPSEDAHGHGSSSPPRPGSRARSAGCTLAQASTP